LYRFLEAVSRKAGTVRADSAGLKLIADYALADVFYADVLFIPGAGSATTLRDYAEVFAWVRSIHATTHWAVMDRLSAWDAEPLSERIVESGKIITAAGVSAGIDMALILAAKIAGPQVAQTLQLGIEYDPDPPFDTGSPKKANPKIRDALLTRMSAQFENIK